MIRVATASNATLPPARRSTFPVTRGLYRDGPAAVDRELASRRRGQAAPSATWDAAAAARRDRQDDDAP